MRYRTRHRLTVRTPVLASREAGTRNDSMRKGTMKVIFNISAAALVAAIAIFAFAAPDAIAAPTHITTVIHLTGGANQTPLVDVHETCAPCGAALDISAPIGVWDVVTDEQVSATESWDALLQDDTAFEPSLVRQGNTLDIDHTLSNPPGTLHVSYHVTGTATLRLDTTPVKSKSFDFTTNTSVPCSAPLPGASSACTDSVSLPLFADLTVFSFPPAPLPPPPPGGLKSLTMSESNTVTTTFTLTSSGITANRHAAVPGGTPIADQALNFGGAELHDLLFVPCTEPVGADLAYALNNVINATNLATHVDDVRHIQLDLQTTIWVPIPLPPFLIPIDGPSIGVFNAEVGSHSIQDLASVPTPLNDAPINLDLGAIQKKNTPPVVDAGGGVSHTYTGNEGSAVVFDGSGSHDVCGFPTLVWNFSDGGIGFGPSPQHVFIDNGTYSGLLTATDVVGNTATTTFTVVVANVNPNVSAGPSLQTDWGRSVAFHANGSDAGAVDNAALLYTWNFDDPNDPLGAAGQDVSHIYSQPGERDAVVTVMDKDGGSNTSTVHVSITKRDVSPAYNGNLSAQITDLVQLRAAVVDEYGQPVVGRLAAFYLDGSLIGSALTDTFGIAGTAWSVPLGTTVGGHALEVRFAGDGLYKSANSLTSTFSVSKEVTVLTNTGVLTSKSSKPVVLTAKLTDDEGNPISGKAITFVLGSQGCTATTNASGIATCTISKLTQRHGPYALTSTFNGSADPNFVSATDTDVFSIQ